MISAKGGPGRSRASTKPKASAVGVGVLLEVGAAGADRNVNNPILRIAPLIVVTVTV